MDSSRYRVARVFANLRIQTLHGSCRQWMKKLTLSGRGQKRILLQCACRFEFFSFNSHWRTWICRATPDDAAPQICKFPAKEAYSRDIQYNRDKQSSAHTQISTPKTRREYAERQRTTPLRKFRNTSRTGTVSQVLRWKVCSPRPMPSLTRRLISRSANAWSVRSSAVTKSSTVISLVAGDTSPHGVVNVVLPVADKVPFVADIHVPPAPLTNCSLFACRIPRVADVVPLVADSVLPRGPSRNCRSSSVRNSCRSCRYWVCRVSESLMYSAEWYCMYNLMPYTRTTTVQNVYGFRVALVDTVFVGRQKVSCIVPCGIVCLFSHPTPLQLPFELCKEFVLLL